MQRSSQRGGRPWRGLSGELPMENERKDREQRIESEIPNHRHAGARWIEMFKMPCVLEREHGDKCDRREQIERKDFAHAEKQND